MSVGLDRVSTRLCKHVVNAHATMVDHECRNVYKALYLALHAAAVRGVSVYVLTQALLDSLQAIPAVCVQDTDQFCQQTLCDPSFVQYVTDNFVCWGGDVRKSDPFVVRQLKASLATLLCCACSITMLYCVVNVLLHHSLECLSYLLLDFTPNLLASQPLCARCSFPGTLPLWLCPPLWQYAV